MAFLKTVNFDLTQGMIDYYKQGHSIQDTADRFNVGYEYLYPALRRGKHLRVHRLSSELKQQRKAAFLAVKQAKTNEKTARNAEIGRLYASGLAATDIAFQFAISQQRVHQILALVLPDGQRHFRRSPGVERERMVALENALREARKMTPQAPAPEAQIPLANVWPRGFVTHLNHPMDGSIVYRGSGFWLVPGRLDYVVRAKAAGHSYQQIAEALGTSAKAVSGVVSRLGQRAAK